MRLLVARLAGAFTAMLIVWLTDVTIRYVPVTAAFGVLFGAIASHRRHPLRR